MHHNKALRYSMFGSLYFTQGTILSYFTALNALYLLDNGLTMTDAGVFASIALLPFVIKIFLGMLSDRVNLFGLGHRKPYIVIGLLVQTLCLVIVTAIDPASQYWLFVGVAFVLQMGMALYDTCTDGIALDTTPEDEQGTIQTFMVGGRAVGVVVTASAVGLLAQHSGWDAVFWLLAGLTLIPLPLVLTAREPDHTQEREFDWQAFAAFKQRAVLALAGLGFVFFLIIAGINQLVNPFLQDAFDIELSTAGFVTTIWGIGVVLGSIVGGRLITRIGKRRAIWIALGISVASGIGLAVITSPAMAWPLVALFGLSYGTYQTVYFALSMNYTDLRIAASMFSILMAFSNVAQGVGMALSGVLADSVGFRWTFIILVAFNVLVLPLLPVIFGRREAEQMQPASA
jgi:PAT family beta-lactamase induction signal transducer AmpG